MNLGKLNRNQRGRRCPLRGMILQIKHLRPFWFALRFVLQHYEFLLDFLQYNGIIARCIYDCSQ